MRWVSSARWPLASSSTLPKGHGPSVCTQAGAPSPEFARPILRVPDFSGRAPCLKALTACTMGSRIQTTETGASCARRLAKKIRVEDIVDVLCEAAEGRVHRLWEPLGTK